MTAAARSQVNPLRHMPILECLTDFFAALRIDVAPPRLIEAGVNHVTVDDDHSLVNSFIAIEDASICLSESRLASILTAAHFDPARTELILPFDLDPDIARRRKSEARSKVRRAVGVADFFDGYLRPAAICQDLLSRGSDDLDSPDSLLYEDDFIDPLAQSSTAGSVLALRHLYGGWAKGTTPRLCMVLAPAGHGKSKLTHILAKRLAREYTEITNNEPKPPLPILIPFGQYRRSTSFAGLILSALDSYGRTLLTVDAFRYLISLGRVLFILDGYDELVETQPETARENISEFIANAGAGSRILLTSRSVFYRTSNDIVSQVSTPTLTESDVEIVDLQPFAPSQAREFLARRLVLAGDRARTLERAQQIVEGEGSREILASPFFLAEFARLVAQGQWSIADVRKQGSLEFLITTTFARERRRQEHDFSDAEQRRFIELIAYDMLLTGTDDYSRDDLELFALESLAERGDDFSEMRKLWTHHFLTSEAGDGGKVTIRHQVWREYFQGSSLAAELCTNEGAAIRILLAKDLPEGVLSSLAKRLVGSVDDLFNVVKAGLSRSGFRNLLRLSVLRSPDAGHISEVLGPRIPRSDLSELRFKGIDFSNIDFSSVNLTGTHFRECNLEQSRFDGAILSRTTFTDSKIGFSIRDADCYSVVIDGVESFGPQVLVQFSLGSGKTSAAGANRIFAQDVLRSRLSKFVIPRGIDECISWIAFMGGSSPREREFIVRRVYRALRAEGFLQQTRAASGGHPPVCLSEDAALRNEVLSFVDGGEPGPAVSAVIHRLVPRISN